MSEKYQKRVLEDMMKRPIPRKWIGIVKLQMGRKSTLWNKTLHICSGCSLNGASDICAV